MENHSYGILENLTQGDKETFLATLTELIAQIDEAQEEFAGLKMLFEGVLKMLPQAVWVLEKDGSFFYYNPEAYKISAILQGVLPLRESLEVEFDSNFYLLQGSLVGDKQIITATNITHQKRQERLASMGQVSAHLAHEIRNPVGSISLLTSTLLKRVDTGSKGLVYEIKKAVWRVENIIKATLMFSKGVSATRDFYTLGEIQGHTQEILHYLASTKPYEVVYRFPESKKVWCDMNLLVIVLQNFLSNALDAIEEGECEEGEIVMEFEEEEEFCVFKVSDNGKEIKDSSFLFEPFKTTKLKGTGLGLALCKQIIEAHEGGITLIHDPKTFIIKIKKVNQIL
ncbi:hypothetical protein BBW65_06050 [Helicobacter enhydrae]|uniref:histidine kinase n=1 Tax=Helicobacter enhydrae TaxID=222136 RepID=A0A1B1U7N8_9HELI|nr:hypothetical protein BBW65_06050 [Helicobacter enhydrae]